MQIKTSPDKCKILIIIPRYEYTNKKNYSYTFPLGLAYISSILKKNNYNVDCLNLNHYNGTLVNIINYYLDKKKYDFVCTGHNSFGYNTIKIILNTIKKNPSRPLTILGGSIITAQPNLYFKNLNPDFGVIGEGEETILNLLDSLQNNKEIKNVKGIIYKADGKIKITQAREPIEDLDTIPLPDFEGFEFEKLLENASSNQFYPYNAFDNPRVYPILGSRSCPFNCTFCYHEGKYRMRSIENIMGELNQMIRKYKINMISLYDDCFAINKNRLKEFCKRISELRDQLSWELKWCPQLTVRDADTTTLKMMKESGCDTLSYGFESYSQKVLKSMKKPITPKQIDCAFKETLKQGMAVQANFIFGDVAETKETAKETLDYWKENAQGQIQLTFIYPYPGSEIYNHCLKKGIIKDEINFLSNYSSSNILNMTEKMSDKEFKKLINEVLDTEGKYCKFITPLSLKKTNSEVFDVIVRCPFCNQIITYKNCIIKNKFSFDFNLVCRNCKMRFYVASPLRKFAYKYHSKIRNLRAIQIKTQNYFRKIKILLSNKRIIKQ